MEKISISANLLNKVMGYLGTRPYQEVFELILNVQAEARAQAEKIEQTEKAEQASE
jgi:hypothetical protein